MLKILINQQRNRFRMNEFMVAKIEIKFRIELVYSNFMIFY